MPSPRAPWRRGLCRPPYVCRACLLAVAPVCLLLGHIGIAFISTATPATKVDGRGTFTLQNGVPHRSYSRAHQASSATSRAGVGGAALFAIWAVLSSRTSPQRSKSRAVLSSGRLAGGSSVRMSAFAPVDISQVLKPSCTEAFSHFTLSEPLRFDCPRSGLCSAVVPRSTPVFASSSNSSSRPASFHARAARFVGGRLYRNARRTSAARAAIARDRVERKHVGARLHEAKISAPEEHHLPYDPSRIRTKIQTGLHLNRQFCSEHVQELTRPATTCFDSGVCWRNAIEPTFAQLRN